jgi:signal transduction histidine kinase
MRSKKKPVFRLPVIFISAVVASGSILAFLSINSISNLKDLTEKRVLEEQKNLALLLSTDIHDEITGVAARFNETVSENTNDHLRAIKYFDTIDLVRNSFIINEDGGFLWPWFIDKLAFKTEKVPSESFNRNFTRAERAEFIDQDFSKASQYYLNSLRESYDGCDSVKSLNALARLSVKMDNRPKALTYYSIITSRYCSVSDRYGFPYIYYAIPQLIRISDASNKQKVLQEIEYCLCRMEAGDIPLNHSTGNLLSQVTNWAEKKVINNDKHLNLGVLIRRINTRLAFIKRNAEVIRGSLVQEMRTEEPLIGDKYKAIKGITPNFEELILINLDADSPVGFTISLDQLWSKVSGEEITEGTEFAYTVELNNKVNGVNSSGNLLTTFAEISPYFPGHQAIIKLKNEGLIDKFIKRRSWIYGIALALLLGGMILGVLLILRDISREEHLAQLRSDFISNVTHELKTPLTSVQLFTESILLERINSETDKREYLRIILKETENLKRMVNNILEFSKKEKGKLEYKFEDVNVTSLVNMAINDLDYWLIEKGFTIQTQVDTNVIATADQVALKQAIINLLNNAIKFSRDSKEILIGVREENEVIMIEVEDKGIGIPEDQKDLIFEPFYRVGQKDAEDISGTGLGLTVVKEIVEAHHGKILVESQLNEGSKFTIILNSMEGKTG